MREVGGYYPDYRPGVAWDGYKESYRFRRRKYGDECNVAFIGDKKEIKEDSDYIFRKMNALMKRYEKSWTIWKKYGSNEIRDGIIKLVKGGLNDPNKIADMISDRYKIVIYEQMYRQIKETVDEYLREADNDCR